MKSIIGKAILFFSVSLLFFSCASQYLGRSVNMNHQSVCSFSGFPASCTYNSKHFLIDYTIEKGENPREYRISGTAVNHDGGSKTWTDYNKATFTLLLVHNRKVVQTVSIAGGQGSLDAPITFQREFKAEQSFRATLINYDMNVKG